MVGCGEVGGGDFGGVAPPVGASCGVLLEREESIKVLIDARGVACIGGQGGEGEGGGIVELV